jgi:type IV pilus assembly protein PilN
VFSVNVFLNELIARRAVSWNRVFKDLGTVMPSNMRLISVRLPQLPSEDTTGVDHLQLDMVLGTDKPETIVTLLKQLESSKLFGAAQLLAETPPSQNDPLYKFRVTVAYDQKL